MADQVSETCRLRRAGLRCLQNLGRDLGARNVLGANVPGLREKPQIERGVMENLQDIRIGEKTGKPRRLTVVELDKRCSNARREQLTSSKAVSPPIEPCRLHVPRHNSAIADALGEGT